MWGRLGRPATQALRLLLRKHHFSMLQGDLARINGHWYVTHKGLLGIASRKHCAGIHVRPATDLCDPAAQRWAFEATVYKSKACRGFVGYGDADPSNVSDLVRGAEMRVAETRAVNRALRKAYGIGICSVEEMRAELQRLKRDTETGRVRAASSATLAAVNEAGAHAARRNIWKIVIPSVVVLIALIAGGLYYHSHRAKPLTDKDTIVLADFANSTRDPVFDDTENGAHCFSAAIAILECAG